MSGDRAHERCVVKGEADAGSTATPVLGPTLGPSYLPTPPLHVPAGWTQVLPGLIVSDTGHFDTLVSNAVQSGRIAACALPPVQLDLPGKYDSGCQESAGMQYSSKKVILVS